VAAPGSGSISGKQIMIDPISVRMFFNTACAAVAALALLGMPSAVAHSTQDTGLGQVQPAHTGLGNRSYIRRQADYTVPDADLRDATGKRVTFAQVLDYDGPLLMNFIFTSCATICPVMSATFGEAQEDLAAIDPRYRMVSVSIDPDYDTPKRLHEYAGLHHARDNWVFLTGGAAEIRKVIAAFDAIYRGDNKMYHLPYTYLRPGKGRPWIRIEGLVSGADLIEEYRSMITEAHSLAD
jgi:cytochrome oxidase Cu insertion factor (SCO1/SenC/PrrC family)